MMLLTCVNVKFCTFEVKCDLSCMEYIVTIISVNKVKTSQRSILATHLDDSWMHHFQLGLAKVLRF